MDNSPLVTDMKDRIRQLMTTQHMSQQSFADILGISPASLSSIFNDRTKPTLNHVEAIRRRFPSVNIDWLLFGNGNMYKDTDSSSTTNGGEMSSFASSGQSTDIKEGDIFGSSRPYNGGKISMPSSSNDEPLQPIVKFVDKPQRKVKEIRIFYDDQTWETFVPSK